MQCRNHPASAAVDRCTGCAESFCKNCLVNLDGQNYCGGCKVMAVGSKTPRALATTPCKEAKDAMICAIVGVFICAPILGLVAIVKGAQSKSLLERDRTMWGHGMANAAMVVGIVDVGLFLIAQMSKLQ